MSRLSRVFSSIDVAEDKPLPVVDAEDGARFVSIKGHAASGKGCLACAPYDEEGHSGQLVDVVFENGDYQEQVPLADVTFALRESGVMQPTTSCGPQLMRVTSTWLRGNAVGVGEDANPLCRPTMEDAHVVVDDFLNGSGLMLGVYDGHGGSEVAEFCAERLHEILEDEFNKQSAAGTYCDAFEPTFAAVNAAVREPHVLFLPKHAMSKGLLSGGCTAVVCVLLGSSPRMLYAANAGDARAVLCQDGSNCRRLTVDHKPTDKHETDRIRALGGEVLFGRVLGRLAVSRAIGDLDMCPYVTSSPYVEACEVTEDDKFLIVACDGVFDVMEDHECSAHLHRMHAEIMAESPQPDKEELSSMLAQGLVDEAMRRGTTDNVTAMIAVL